MPGGRTVLFIPEIQSKELFFKTKKYYYRFVFSQTITASNTF